MSETNTYAATMTRSQIPTTVPQTAESPPSKSYIVTGDTTYRIIGESHSAPSTVVSSERAFIHAVVVFMNDADVALLKTYVSGWGTVALMLGDNGGRSITMSHARVDSLLFLDEEYSLPRHSDGSRCGLLSISSDMRWFRST